MLLKKKKGLSHYAIIKIFKLSLFCNFSDYNLNLGDSVPDCAELDIANVSLSWI